MRKILEILITRRVFICVNLTLFVLIMINLCLWFGSLNKFSETAFFSTKGIWTVKYVIVLFVNIFLSIGLYAGSNLMIDELIEDLTKKLNKKKVDKAAADK